MNVDFADVRTIMTGAGSSLMGQGRASGKGRAKEAALAAISSPLLDIGIERATGIVWNITGPPDMTLFEVLPLLGCRHPSQTFPVTAMSLTSSCGLWKSAGHRMKSRQESVAVDQMPYSKAAACVALHSCVHVPGE